VRCPTCNATNPETATFCGQCYERFPPAAAATSHTPPADHPPDETDGPAAPGAAPSGPDTPWHGSPGPAGARDAAAETAVAVGRFALGEEGLTWRCGICETTNAADAFVCSICGARMDAEARDPSTSPVDRDRAIGLDRVLPGLGHLRSGQVGMGSARLGIVALWFLGALALLSGGPSGLLTALPLLIGMAVVWITGPADLAAALDGRTPRLDARRFMYVVIGVTTGVIVAGGLAVIV
jgi:hypothetical protein